MVVKPTEFLGAPKQPEKNNRVGRRQFLMIFAGGVIAGLEQLTKLGEERNANLSVWDLIRTRISDDLLALPAEKQNLISIDDLEWRYGWEKMRLPSEALPTKKYFEAITTAYQRDFESHPLVVRRGETVFLISGAPPAATELVPELEVVRSTDEIQWGVGGDYDRVHAGLLHEVEGRSLFPRQRELSRLVVLRTWEITNGGLHATVADYTASETGFAGSSKEYTKSDTGWVEELDQA